MQEDETKLSASGLARELGFKEAIGLVVGSIIGTGIFLKTGIMSQTLGSPTIVLVAWIVAGLLSLAGALTYAELGSLFPRAGGEYVYLKETYGSLPAFLYGWMRFWIATPGSIAAYAVGAATFCSAVGGGFSNTTLVGLAMIFVVSFSLLNCLSVSVGGRLQVLLTALKVLIILTIIVGCFFLSGGSAQGFATPSDWHFTGWSTFGAALVAALWAYDGWNNLPMASGEVKDAQRNVPKALAIGTITILFIYGLINLSYFYALPFKEILNARGPMNPQGLAVATVAVTTFLGVSGVAMMSIAFAISAVGAMNGAVLTGARVPYAMARDGLFLKSLGYVSPKTRSPIVAILVQMVWACALAYSGSFDQLTDYVIFSSYVFYAMCASAVIVLRLRHPEWVRSYKVPGYPIVPIVFILLTIALLANTLMTSPRASLTGLAIIAVGAPVYWFVFRRKNELG